MNDRDEILRDLDRVRSDVRDAFELADDEDKAEALGRVDRVRAFIVEVAQLCAEEEADSRWHRAMLRRHMAEHGLEDPTWRNLSQAEKAVLYAADAEVLASSERRLPSGMRAA